MMWLRSGRLVDPLNLDFSLITLDDLAWSLAHVNRWGGHCDPAISVAQHALACALSLATSNPRLALLALHHDDGEAFFGDMCRDLKCQPEMAWYREREEHATLACIRHFAPEVCDLPLSAIKPVDMRSLLTERADRFPRDKDATDYHPELEPLERRHFVPGEPALIAELWQLMHCSLRGRLA